MIRLVRSVVAANGMSGAAGDGGDGHPAGVAVPLIGFVGLHPPSGRSRDAAPCMLFNRVTGESLSLDCSFFSNFVAPKVHTDSGEYRLEMKNGGFFLAFGGVPISLVSDLFAMRLEEVSDAWAWEHDGQRMVFRASGVQVAQRYWRLLLKDEVYIVKVWRALHWFSAEDLLVAAPRWKEVSRWQTVQGVIQMLARAVDKLGFSKNLVFRRPSKRGSGYHLERCLDANVVSTIGLLLLLAMQSHGGNGKNDMDKVGPYKSILEWAVADALGDRGMYIELHPTGRCDVTVKVPKLGRQLLEVFELMADLTQLSGTTFWKRLAGACWIGESGVSFSLVDILLHLARRRARFLGLAAQVFSSVGIWFDLEMDGRFETDALVAMKSSTKPQGSMDSHFADMLAMGEASEGEEEGGHQPGAGYWPVSGHLVDLRPCCRVLAGLWPCLGGRLAGPLPTFGQGRAILSALAAPPPVSAERRVSNFDHPCCMGWQGPAGVCSHLSSIRPVWAGVGRCCNCFGRSWVRLGPSQYPCLHPWPPPHPPAPGRLGLCLPPWAGTRVYTRLLAMIVRYV